MTGIPDRGYDDHDDYTTTVEGARGSAGRHALVDPDDPQVPTRAELAQEAREDRRRGWRR